MASISCTVVIIRSVWMVETPRNTSKYNFFFQAEDGIRDYKVTGVQTCALPISMAEKLAYCGARRADFWPLALFDAAFDPSLSEEQLFQFKRDIPIVYIGILSPTKIDRKSVV